MVGKATMFPAVMTKLHALWVEVCLLTHSYSETNIVYLYNNNNNETHLVAVTRKCI